MRQFSCIQLLWKSFYSKSAYRDVKNNWGFNVLLYAFLLLAISGGIQMIPFHRSIDTLRQIFVDKYLPQLPEITIEKGKLSTPEHRPYFIKDPDTQEMIGVIDTTGKYKDIDQTEGVVLVTQNQFISRSGETIKIMPIPSTLSMSVTKDQVKSFLHKAVSWAYVLAFPFLFLFSFVARFIQCLIFSFLSWIYAKVASISLSFGDVFKLSWVAMTPMVLVTTVLFSFSNVAPGYEFLLSIFLFLGYLIFAIRANK